MAATGYNITTINKNVTCYIYEFKSKFCHTNSILHFLLFKHSRNFINNIIDQNNISNILQRIRKKLFFVIWQLVQWLEIALQNMDEELKGKLELNLI